jgi:HK97 family phage major capsid protein
MKSLKVLTRFSNELARQSVISLDAALKARLVGDVAAKLDAQLFPASGDGTTTPRGLFAWHPGPARRRAAGPGRPARRRRAGAGRPRRPARVRWVMTSRELVQLRKLKDNQDRYLIPARPHRGRRVPAAGPRGHRDQPRPGRHRDHPIMSYPSGQDVADFLGRGSDLNTVAWPTNTSR